MRLVTSSRNPMFTLLTGIPNSSSRLKEQISLSMTGMTSHREATAYLFHRVLAVEDDCSLIANQISTEIANASVKNGSSFTMRVNKNGSDQYKNIHVTMFKPYAVIPNVLLLWLPKNLALQVGN